MSTSLEQTTLAVEGMTCSACVNAIERALNSIEGVKASVNFGSETVHILAPGEMGCVNNSFPQPNKHVDHPPILAVKNKILS